MSVLSPVIDLLDPAAKLIYLAAGVREYHPVDDIYKEVRNRRVLDESLRKYKLPVAAAGAVPKGGGKFTPRYAIFNDGWQVVPEDVSHSLYVTGEQITDDGQSGPACINTSVLSPGTNVIIQYEPPAAEIIVHDSQDIARAVRSELTVELAGMAYILKVLKNKRVVQKAGNVWQLTVYDNDGAVPILVKDLKDKDGNNVTDFQAGMLTQELANQV